MDSYRNLLFDNSQVARILGIIADTLLIVNKEGMCLDFKPSKTEVFFKQDVIGKNVLTYFPAHVAEEIKGQFDLVSREGKRSSHKYKIPFNGVDMYCKCIINKLDENALIFQFRDVTERSIRKQNMMDKIKKMNEIERIAKLGYWSYNTQTDELSYYGSTGILCKEDKEEKLPLSVYLLYVHINDRIRFKNWLDSHLKDHELNVDKFIEYRIIVNDQPLNIRAKVYGKRVHKDKVILEGYIQNISDIIQRDTRLDLITRAINHVSEDIFAIRPNRTFYFGNISFKRHHGLPEDMELNGISTRKVGLLVNSEDKLKKNWELLKRPHFVVEEPYENFPEILAYEYATYTMKDSLGEEMIWIFGRDISERIKFERKQEEDKKKAEHASQLKSAFLANMSHEIRTPLNAILGFSRIITETNDHQQRQEYYDIVERNNYRLQELINEILDLSKIEAGTMEFNYSPVGLHNLCDDVKNTLIFRCQNEVKLIFEESDRHLITSTDRSKLFQVFSNLIGNATKFTSKGSIRFGYKKIDEQIVFHVSDTGCGIPKDKLEDIFNRHFMASKTVQGTGLGLSISKIIIEKMGGKIWVSSKVGEGTTFTFTIPHVPVSGTECEYKRRREVQQQESQATKTPTKVRTILVAEDNDSSYELLEAMIGNTHRLIRAYDGVETVQLAEECKPDMILMDIKMPNIDGLDATRAIREMDKDIPVIAVSAYAYENEKEEAMESGCNEFLTKPIDYDILKKTLNKYFK